MNFPSEAHVGVLGRGILGVDLQDPIAVGQGEMRQLTLQVTLSPVGQDARIRGTPVQSQGVVFDRTLRVVRGEGFVP